MFSFNQKTYLLLAIIILSIIFFICGILHLLIKYFLKPINSESEEIASATAFQGQLQQLFHLHDEGVDQSFIDSLPIFLYKSIIGLKDPFDCVVCLCEFELDDKLRLLPNCSHAFHIECIDTWLLSHSTCPLCRKSLLHEYSSESSSDPGLNVEDDFTQSRHLRVKDDLNLKEHTQSMELPLMQDLMRDYYTQSHPNICKETVSPDRTDKVENELNLQYVKLGKFRNVEVSEEGTSRNNGDLKERCFSMGAIEYVMNESTVLQVAIKTLKKHPNRINDGNSARISDKCSNEIFSISKISMGSRRERAIYDDFSRRAFSFRLPKQISDFGLDVEAGRKGQKTTPVSRG
ncbi:RING-H2 finger protein ATL13 [Dendrobium catenatum]|nr:RING-H2 finger protein ATL13 [Dendrobium catenatum]